jgi:hypothetical protein
MDPLLPAQLQYLQKLHSRLHARLLALDQLLGSVPLQQQRYLDLEAILPEDTNDPNSQEFTSPCRNYSWDALELFKVVDTVPRFDLIPATLIHVCKTSWQGRIFEDVYRDSDINESRDPFCSEVLHLLPKIDQVLGTSLSGKINSIVSLGKCYQLFITHTSFNQLSAVPPFRFLDLPTEIRLHIYAYILPRQPYLTLLDLEPRRHAMPRYSLACLRTCQRIYNELVDDFYKDQTLVMNIYDIEESYWALKKTSPRDHRLALNMRTETRSCFKKLEIRLLDMKDPNAYRKGPYWELTKSDVWNSDPYFTYTIEAFPNLESVTVSFEVEEVSLRYWGGWHRSLGYLTKGLASQIPEHIEVRWDFHPTSHPDLQEVAENEEEGLMYESKKAVDEEAAERGVTVHLGTSIIKEYIVPWRINPMD